VLALYGRPTAGLYQGVVPGLKNFPHDDDLHMLIVMTRPFRTAVEARGDEHKYHPEPAAFERLAWNKVAVEPCRTESLPIAA
jgi:hypothetical protein